MSLNIISLHNQNPLAHRIAQQYKSNVHVLDVCYFPDGELYFNETAFKQFKDSAVVIVHSLGSPVHENIFSLLLAVDRLKKEGVRHLTLIIPYVSYARQCQSINQQPGAIGLLISSLENAGVDEFVCVEMHKAELAHLFSRPITNVITHNMIAHHIEETVMDYSDYCVVAPDKGATARAHQVAQQLGIDLIVATKRRTHNEKVIINLGQAITKKKAIIIDDMISTGDTILELADCLAQRGITSSIVYAVHPVFSANAFERLMSCRFFEKIIVCNTLAVLKSDPKLEILDCSPLIVNALSASRILNEHNTINQSGYKSHNRLGKPRQTI